MEKSLPEMADRYTWLTVIIQEVRIDVRPFSNEGGSGRTCHLLGGFKLKTEYRGTFLGLGYLEIQLQVIRKSKEPHRIHEC